MDIHRCRFVQYPPQSINALAFSHISHEREKTPSDLRLAVGRNNGDIELWNPQNGLWVQDTILKGSKDTTIEQLAWTQDLMVDDSEGSNFSYGPLRLFSTSGSNSVIEWDMCTGTSKRRAEGNFGDIWCFAAQPQAETTEKSVSGAVSQLLAAGCSNGTVVLFSTEDDDLRYLRPLLTPPVKKPKVLSITWRDHRTVVAGYEDSTIRVIDVPSRKIIRNMSLGKPADGNNSVVWTVKCLADGTILSGDSSGELKIWDAKNYSLVQRLKSHQADILDIAVSASGNMIFSFGVDRRTVSYKPVAMHPGTKKMRWAEVSHRRIHRHDVKCCATFESSDLSILVSGGIDASPVVVPMRRSQTEFHRRLPHLPQRPQISASSASRLFISWWSREIVVYHVRKHPDLSENNFDFDEALDPSYEALTRLVIEGNDNIQDAQISEDGQFIVTATINKVKMFQLRKTQASGRPCLRTRRVELPPSVANLGARRIGFSPDCKWLYTVRKDNTLALLKIIPSQELKERPVICESLVKLYRPSRKSSESALGTYQRTITQVAFSSDSRVLAVGDLSGAIDVWLLEGHEDLDYVEAVSDKSSESSASSSTSSSDDDEDDSPVVHAQKWVRNPAGFQLAQLGSSILALTFRPSPDISASGTVDGNRGLHVTRHNAHPVAHEYPTADTKLFAITATHQIVEFDVLDSRLSEWSRRNPSKFLPRDFTRIKDRVKGCFWDCNDRENKGERLWLYGSAWLFMFDVSQDLQQEATISTNGTDKTEKIGTLGGYDVLEPVKGTDGNPGKPLKTLGSLHDREQAGNKKRKRNIGAGDAIPDGKYENVLGSTMVKFKGDHDDAEMIDVAADAELSGERDSDMEDENVESLALMRRKQSSSDSITNPSPTQSPNNSRPSQWHTFAYQSILGISVLGPPRHPDPSSAPAQSGNEGETLEVVIVERDVYDVDQLPRFDGGQEWET